MRRALPLCLTILAASGAFAVGCADTVEPAPPQLVLVIDSNARVPADFDAVKISVSPASTGVIFENTYAVGESGLPFPGTITMAAGDKLDDLFSVTVSGVNQISGAERVVNKMVLTEPKSGVKMLRVPLDFLCLDVTCGTGQTCIAGACASSAVDVTKLEDYSEEKLYGGTTKRCFDTNACFAAAAEVALSDGGAGCKTSLSAVDSVNYGLWFKADPACTDPATPGCIIPLDRDSSAGWQKSNDVVLLPQAVCELAKAGKVALIGTLICESKTIQTSACANAPIGTTPIVPGTVPGGGVQVFDAGSPLSLGNRDGGK